MTTSALLMLAATWAVVLFFAARTFLAVVCAKRKNGPETREDP